MDAVHLCYKDGCHGFVERCAVHVDSATNRKNEASHSRVDVVVHFTAAKCDRERRRTVDGERELILVNIYHFTLNLNQVNIVATYNNCHCW